ncbi:MAG: hypothetical protein A3D16_20010 [Rhodobacterales bacterium RIFCSPHIGHO2_02_FULL_62_130]|nr:MAG: hypothetical protein A3D16_20010 [Rhodobacterales bacterium RIFCSPHIGHO2_02_FULL_62_130]OHC60239.1 MAG: hypothetical protein A3E48_17080 [Rhodobacterales bacterium RIFCSPHIGHO2_12_FULL_62_75]HCY99382.1 hypothetical protein [Rhodobacter sp.]
MKSATLAALALGVVATPVHAQSILERVLGQIDGASKMAPITGVFVNSAENVGSFGVESVVGQSTVYMLEGAEVSEADYLAAREEMILTELSEVVYTPGTVGYVYDSTSFVTEAEALAARQADVDAFFEAQSATIVYAPAVTTYAFLGEPYYTAEQFVVVYPDSVPADADRINISTPGYPYGGTTYGTEAAALAAVAVAAEAAYSDILPPTADSWSYAGVSGTEADSAAAAEAAALTLFGNIASLTEGSGFVETLVPTGIDGSISNILLGLAGTTQAVTGESGIGAVVQNLPTMGLGDMATTVLGAVNTGNIELGVNATLSEAQARSSSAVSTAAGQVGGSADMAALVLNVAANMTWVDGSISNSLTAVNGTVGNLSTTTLGAVNTGAIVSGVKAAVGGVVGQN